MGDVEVLGALPPQCELRAIFWPLIHISMTDGVPIFGNDPLDSAKYVICLLTTERHNIEGLVCGLLDGQGGQRSRHVA
jgi:hypothetical protein